MGEDERWLVVGTRTGVSVHRSEEEALWVGQALSLSLGLRAWVRFQGGGDLAAFEGGEPAPHRQKTRRQPRRTEPAVRARRGAPRSADPVAAR